MKKTTGMLLVFIVLGFSSLTMASNKKKTPQRNSPKYVSPYLYEGYESQKGKMSDEFLDLLNRQENIFIKNLLIAGFELHKQKIGYKRTANKLTKNAINCTGLIRHLFNSIALNYGGKIFPSKEIKKVAARRETLDLSFMPKSSSMEDYWNQLVNFPQWRAPASKPKASIVDYFRVQSLQEYKQMTGLKHFYPQAGDVLAYYNPKRREGHAVIVIDPLRCIAQDSSPYTFEKGNPRRMKGKEGVQYRYLSYPSCNPLTGEWFSWGKAKNRFEVLMRHRKFYNDSKHFLANR